MSWLAPGPYREVLRRVPILCVDGILSTRGGKYLLVKRRNEPMRARWWVPGGRVRQGETLEGAFARKMREELGVRVRRARPVGYFEIRYRSRDLGAMVHAVSIVFSGSPVDLQVRLDHQSSDWGLFDRLPARFRVRPFAGR